MRTMMLGSPAIVKILAEPFRGMYGLVYRDCWEETPEREVPEEIPILIWEKRERKFVWNLVVEDMIERVE